jgi:serine/threonine protein kinase
MSDAKAIVVIERQVTCVDYSRDEKQTRRAFEVMSVSIIADEGNRFFKQLLLVDSRRHEKVVPLPGASVYTIDVSSSHPRDVQPSFAKHSICIRTPDSMIGWLVASPSAEEQRRLLDRLCVHGCIARDFPDHIALLPEPAQSGIRLGRPTSSRTTTNADIVALKIATDSDRVSQLLNEVQLLMNLHHDAILSAYGVYEVKVEGRRSLAMVLDYKTGEDLSCWIPKGGLPECIVRCLMAPICDAMVYLHGISIVHRDIKPSNVLCERGRDGFVQVVLADLGLATHIMDKKRVSQRCGTGGYIAPEVFREAWATEVGAMEFGAEKVANITKTDAFSFGMMVYTILFGKNPFVDVDEESTYRRNARGLLSFAKMGGRSDELQSLLAGLCAKNPRHRYSSSDAYAHEWFSSDPGVPGLEDELGTAKVTWAAFKRAALGFSQTTF